MMSSKIKTYNFSLSETDGVQGGVDIYDKRNRIESELTNLNTIDFYINYLTTLQIKQSQWTNYGYFDMGMVPLVMGPSMTHILIHTFFVSWCINQHIPFYEMPPVSFLGGQVKQDIGKDIWVFRKDIAPTVGEDELNFSIINYIDRQEVKSAWQEMYQNH